MSKNIHVIFPSQFKDLLVDNFRSSNKYNLNGFDSDIKTYSHYILNPETTVYCDTAFISVCEDDLLPLIAVVEETVEIAVQIKLTRQDLRMVFVFPDVVGQAHEYRTHISKLIMAGIYDLRFQENFGFEQIENWLDEKMTINHLAKFITSSEINRLQNGAYDGAGFEDTVIPVAEPVQEVNNQQASQIPYTPKTDDAPVEEKTKGLKAFFSKKQSADKAPKPKKEKVAKAPKKKPLLNKRKKAVISKLNSQQLSATQLKATKKIGVFGLVQGSGTTFIATNLASFLAETGLNVGVYENPLTKENRTYLADLFMFFNEDKANESLPHSIVAKDKFNDRHKYKVQNTHYYPVNYKAAPINEFEPYAFIRYINTGVHDVKITDIGSVSLEEVDTGKLIDVLSIFDEVIMVVNPLPTKLIPNTEKLLKLQNELILNDVNFSTVLNQSYGELQKKDIDFLRLSKAVHLPSVEHTVVLQAMLQKQNVYDYDLEAAEVLNPSLLTLAHSVGLPIQVNEETADDILASQKLAY